MNFTGDHSFGFDLHASLRKNHSIKPAGDHYAIALDLTFHFGAFAEDYGLLRDDVALHVAVNAERAFDRQRAFERYALVNESGPLFACAILCGAGPLPCHSIPPNRDSSYFSRARP